MQKKVQIFVLVLVVILVVSAFTTLPVHSLGNDDTDIVLIETSEPKEIEYMETLGANIIETYENYVLVEIDSSELFEMKRMGMSIENIEKRTTLYVGGHQFDFSQGEPDIRDELHIEYYESGEMGQYIVHMVGPIASHWRPTLEDKGVQVLNYIHNYGYRVRMTPELAEEVSELYFVDWIGIYHPEYKLQDGLERGIIDIGMVPGASLDTLNELRETVPILSHVETSDGRIRLRTVVDSIETLYKIANIPDVSYISEYIEPELHSEVDSQIIGGGVWVMDNDDDPSTPYREHGDYGAYINQIGYTGDGVVVAVADTGLGDGTTPDAGHLDFTGRVLGGYYWEGSGWQDGHSHGTHCAGSVAGDTYSGTGVEYAGFGPYYVSQGLAYESDLYGVKIFSDAGGWAGPSDYADIVEVAKQNADAYVHSNSWGSESSGSYGEADSVYDAVVRDADRDTLDNRPMVITVSAGNAGDGYQTTGSPGNAKNIITVGAAYSYMPDSGDYGYHEGWGPVDNPDEIVEFSSRGWTADNRIKPDVVAPGYGILSTMSPDAGSGSYSPDGRYEWMQGTSMSNPATAGAAAVTTQWYEINHGERPSPAMVKGLLINTAHDLDDDNGNTGPIPNRDEGWGSVDLSKLEYPLNDPVPFFLEDQTSTFTESLQEDEYQIMSDREDVPMKFSLVWTDEEAPSGTGSDRTLINDLNIEVESPSGLIYRGNAFSGGWTQPGQNTMGDFDYSGDGWDDTNNVENVYIHPDEVELGVYTVRVRAQNIAGDAVGIGENSQDYALVAYNGMEEIPGEPPQIDLTNPTGGEVWHAGTQEEITWDTTTGDDPIDYVNLYYSIDGGDSYETIANQIPDTGSHMWDIPNEDSDDCLVRAQVVDEVGRTNESISGVFKIEGIPPEPPQNLLVEHYGESVQVIFEDDVSEDLGYSTGSSGGTNEWGIRTHGAFIGDQSWDWGDGSYDKEGEVSWLISPEITIPANADMEYGVELTFQHWRDIVDTWDGVNIKVSTDGDNWELIEDPDPGYDHTIGSGYSNPIEGEDAWGGSVGWEEVSVDLSDFIGETVQFRWDAGVEQWSADGGAGWRIDDIYIEALIADEEGDDHNFISWDASQDDPDEVSHYNVYRSEEQSGPWDETALIDSVEADGSVSYGYVDHDRGMVDEIFWWYVVRAVGDNGLEEENENTRQEPGEGEPPTVTINSPNGGEQWESGTMQEITWSASTGDDPVESINLWYSSDSGSTWNTIESGLDDTSSYIWNIPNDPSDQCLVRVRAIDTVGRYSEDVSDNHFEILGIPPAPPQNLIVEHYGESVQVLIEDDVSEDLGYITGESHTDASEWGIRQHDSVIGSNSWDFGDGEFNKNADYGMLSSLTTPEIEIPAEADEEYGVDFTFQHWYDWGDTSQYDAGNVKISTEGSDGPWTLITPEEGYDGTVPETWNNPLGGEEAWGGSTDWTIATFDLTGYIGETIHIRWDAGVEEYDGMEGPGWRLDDIYMEVQTSGEGDDHNLLTWNASVDEPEVSHYNIYRSEDQTGPWDGTTLIDSVAADGSESYDYIDFDRGMADEIYWWYVVRAVGDNGLEEENVDTVQEPGATLSTFDIQLYADADSDGWNFVSFNLDLEDTNLESILDGDNGISGNYDKVMYYDAAADGWYSYVTNRTEHYNNLDTWDHTMGLWIRMTADDTLTVEGIEPTDTTITLESGWNMVSYPSGGPGTGVPEQVTQIGYFDAAAEYNVAYTAEVDTFEFTPGEGYWLYAEQQVDWTVTY